MKNINIQIKKSEDKIIPFVWINNKSENEFHITSSLTEDGSHITLLGIFLGTKENYLKFDTDLTHIGLHTKSLTILRAVFLNNSIFSNDGMIRISKGAKNTNAYFDSKVLLFDNARGRSIPSLEIDENEVKAGHGSTIGRPDADQIIYLRSRGLSEDAAERLIITGFFEPALKLLDAGEKQKILKKINQTLTEL